jgi:tRNA-Thr(GGU) m(6)t(6)A37 methyltransferase TsaA
MIPVNIKTRLLGRSAVRRWPVRAFPPMIAGQPRRRRRAMERMTYSMRPIGVVRSSLHDVRDAPNQAFEGAPEATLEIDPAFVAALHRVTPGQDLILLTWLHESDRSVLQTHPRGDPNMPLTGVFATRSPDRPNPIGLHRVAVTAVEAPTRLRVRALEAVDGTPILDLKAVLDESTDE